MPRRARPTSHRPPRARAPGPVAAPQCRLRQRGVNPAPTDILPARTCAPARAALAWGGGVCCRRSPVAEPPPPAPRGICPLWSRERRLLRARLLPARSEPGCSSSRRRLLLFLCGCTKSSSEGPGSPLKAAAGNLRCPRAMSPCSAPRRSPWITGGCSPSGGRVALTALGFVVGRYLALALRRSPLSLPCSPLSAL